MKPYKLYVTVLVKRDHFAGVIKTALLAWGENADLKLQDDHYLTSIARS